MLTETQIAELLTAVLAGEDPSDVIELPPGGIRVRTFEEAGVLSGNTGLVVSIGEASFQVSIIAARSRY